MINFFPENMITQNNYNNSAIHLIAMWLNMWNESEIFVL